MEVSGYTDFGQLVAELEQKFSKYLLNIYYASNIMDSPVLLLKEFRDYRGI